MQTFIFLCNLTTEQECLDRSLFGTNGGEQLRHHYSKIEVGDRLFLYNYEIGVLRGPFTAMTTCTHNLEPTAWKRSRGKFPWQVRVDATEVSKEPIRADDFAVFIPLAQTKIGLLPPAELSDEQVDQLLTAIDEVQPQ